MAQRRVAAVVVALFVHRGQYAVVWAGDSRAYLLRDGDVVRLTRDHVSEDARYVTRAIGAADLLMVDVARGAAMPGDRFVLCSDGLVKATGAAVLDAGVSRVDGKIAGDVAPDVAEVAGFLSPNPGGGGPMTRAMLLSNVVEAAERGLADA